MFEYGITKTITNPASGGTVDITPQSGVSYAGTEIVTVTDSSGTPLILGTDYTYTLTPSPPSFTWINPLTGDYTVTVTQLDSASAPLDYVSNSNGFSFSETPSSGILDVLKLNASDVTTIAAQDAILYLDGMRVTRATNVIEDLITDVKLELVGAIGDVTMNVTQDAQKAIDAVQAYADAYNEVITWINEKLDEKYTSSSVAADDDYLQDILAASKGETVFGTLHGDQLLWSIKNQMRNSLANPIAMNARALVTRSFANTLTPLGIDAEINLYAGGLASRIKILPTYSLSRIRDLVASALVETSKNGTTPIGSTMDLEVSIANGQLVINYNSSLPLANQKTENIVRNHDTTTIGLAGSANYDILSFTPSENAPVNGKFTVQVGDYGTDAAGNPIVPTFYQEGADFNVVTRYTTPASPALPYFESFIEWKPGRIADNTQYKVTYDYNSAAVGYSVVSDTNNSLSTLRFSIDSSQSQLSTFGLVTTADDFGKSGLLEFDTEKLFAAIAGNANNTSNVLTEYFKEMDTYINSLVSSTASLIGGTTYTTGRIANAVQSLELQINDLNTRISKLEAQLAARQTSMYKQYSDMEVAIQTLNAQLSSMTQYFASTTSTS
jgi:flagellar capping protein FliD